MSKQSFENPKYFWNIINDLQEKLDNSIAQVKSLIVERDENKQKVEELENRIGSDLEAFVESMEVISSSMVRKDRLFCKKVMNLAVAVAEEMGLDEDSVFKIKYLSRLHLVGLLFTDTPESFKLFPSQAVPVLKKNSGLENIISDFEDLDECFDGGGPMKKKGSLVSLSVRIVRGAAFYCFFLNGDFTNRDITEKLDEASGTELDPNVVSVMYKILVKKDFFSDSDIIAVGLNNLLPGMTLASGVFSKRGAMLVPAGVNLDVELINKIIAYNLGEEIVDLILVKQ